MDPISPRQRIDQLEYIMALQTERIEAQLVKIDDLQAELGRLVAWIADGSPASNGSAIQALVEIMRDASVTLRRRLRAAENILSHKAPEAIVELCKAFLTSVFLDPDTDIDVKLEATALMRKLEGPKVMPGIERIVPPRDEDQITPEEWRRRAAELMERRREHIDRVAAENAAELERQRLAGLIP
jgi:hypothetical protein